MKHKRLKKLEENAKATQFRANRSDIIAAMKKAEDEIEWKTEERKSSLCDKLKKLFKR